MAKNRRWAALAAAGLLAMMLAIQLWGAAPVLAHARYKSSSPEKGAIVPISPSRVEVTFTNDIQKVASTYDLTVTKDRGPSVTAGPAVVDDADRSKLSVPLQPNLDPGRYVVRWKNVSDEDGDPAEGAFSFYIGDYTPTAVDRDNDAQLDLIGEEDGATPSTGGDTPVSSEDTPAAGPTTVRTQGPAGTPTSGGGAEVDTDEDGDGAANVVIIIIVAVVVAAIAAVAGFMFTRRRT